MIGEMGPPDTQWATCAWGRTTALNKDSESHLPIEGMIPCAPGSF